MNDRNIMFVGDVHLSPRTPISRKDDYPQTMLNKLSKLYNVAKENKVNDIIFLGDIFNTRHMTLNYFIKCFKVFSDLASVSKLHLVVGNHDITYNNESTLQDSPIQILYDSGLFERHNFKENILPVALDEDELFYFYDYTVPVQEIQPVPEGCKGCTNFLIGHYFYCIGFGDEEHTLTKEMCSKLGYNYYILGHDHTPYTPVKTKEYEVHRPGSLSRATSNTCQVSRDTIQVVIYNTKTKQFTYKDLEGILPSKEVYKENILVDKITLSSISESLQDFLNALDFNNTSDIYDTLNSIPMDNKVKDIIIKYLEAEGVYQQGGS